MKVPPSLSETKKAPTTPPDVLLAVVRDLDLGLAGQETPPDWTPPPVPKPRKLPVPRKRHSLVSSLPDSGDAATDSTDSSGSRASGTGRQLIDNGSQADVRASRLTRKVDGVSTWPSNKSASTSVIVEIPPTASDPRRFLETYFSVEEPVDVDAEPVNDCSSVLKTSRVIDVDDSDQDESVQRRSLPYQAEFETLKKLSEASINALKGKSTLAPNKVCFETFCPLSKRCILCFALFSSSV